MRVLALSLLLAGCATQAWQAPTPAWVNDTSSFGSGATHAPAPSRIADHYRDVAAKIVAAARVDRGAYQKLAYLTDHIGHRLAGSPELDQAIAWAAKTMKDAGLTVHTEKVMVPHWVRGPEEGAIIAPSHHALHVLTLGGSIATPKGGITAPVVVVHSWKELEANADKVKGAIVVYNVAMPTWSEEHGSGYGKTVEYRWAGASQAAKHGALAALVRSVTAKSLSTPHTGSMAYDKQLPKIPTASISVEDTELLDRLARQGEVKVHVRIEPQQLPDAESANVIGELRGREKPDEVVVISGHIDSWDVGQGAHDDGAGCVVMMQALELLKRLELTPRRTIRVVLFTNEENGTRGARAYAERHAAELPNTVLALESDSGGFAPRGFSTAHKDAAAEERMRARLADIVTLLGPLGPLRVEAGYAGTDIEAMQPAGVPQVGLDVAGEHYFDYHHTNADTLDKVDPQDLADNVAATAVLAYVVADMPGRVDAP